MQDVLLNIIDLLRTKTAYDFRLYKPGTLQRRVERRMAMAAVEADDMAQYLEILRGDSSELDLLAKDLLINVTSFFRDPKVFDLLAAKIIPDLVRQHAPDQSLRIWIAGCSTGEETYSLTMLFREAIASAKLNIRLQVFASDVDPDAVPAPARASIRKRSRRKCRRHGWPTSFRRTITATGYRPSCARPWCSRCRTCWPIRRFHASTWFRAAIF
jgi:chemotaxis methyl-accepting protein methylase